MLQKLIRVSYIGNDTCISVTKKKNQKNRFKSCSFQSVKQKGTTGLREEGTKNN